MTILFGGQGVQPTLRGQPTNVISLPAGQTRIIPAGTWQITTGLYSCVQENDAISDIWRGIGSGYGNASGTAYVNSDGNNFRIANQSGCAVGAIVTTAGAGYTSAPTVTASSGGSSWIAVVGGAVNTSVTVSNGGTNYTYPPIVTFDAPNLGAGTGVQATGHAVLTGSAVSSIVVDDQGAGYTSTPSIYLNNDPREGLNGTTIGTGATATCTLTGAGTITAVLGLDHGSALTALPTLAFAGTSTSGAAATTIMNWAVTGYTVSATGGFYTSPVLVTNVDTGFTSGVGSTTNPTITSNLVRTRPVRIKGVVTAGSITATGATVIDGGVVTGVPTLVALAAFASGTAASVAATVGGLQDVSILLPV